MNLRSPWLLALLTALCLVLAFPALSWSLLTPFAAWFLVLLVVETSRSGATIKKAFGYGFLVGYLAVLGGGYWIAYVIHEFGRMNWFVSVFIFLLACGFEAFNFPIFVAAAAWLHRKVEVDSLKSPWRELWYVLALPSLFVLVEYFTPKLFPWLMGHSLFNILPLIQIAEITGSTFFSFWILSLGAAFAMRPLSRWAWSIPTGLVLVSLMFGAYRLASPPSSTTVPFRALLIQANIGSFEKVKAENGDAGIIETVIRRYIRLTDEAMANGARPQLILWPEAAIPVYMDDPTNFYVKKIKEKILSWNVPLVTGSFSRRHSLIYNTAFLMTPTPDREVTVDAYDKNVLLAFGEYMPLGDEIPALYKYFPTVSHFGKGEGQRKFSIAGRDLGITICYEAILPSYFRKVVSLDVQGVINLTNDSWFGPTNEPMFHGTRTVFRAIENRLPILRVANTGLSFTVDDMGAMHDVTNTFKEGYVDVNVALPEKAPRTVYSRFGDWFVVLCFFIFSGFVAKTYPRRKREAEVTPLKKSA